MAIFNRMIPVLNCSSKGSGMILSGSASYKTFLLKEPPLQRTEIKLVLNVNVIASILVLGSI